MHTSGGPSRVRMTGVRILGAAEGAEFAESVPHALASIAALLTEGTVTVALGTEPGTNHVVVDVHTDTHPEPATFTDSVTEILTPVGQVRVDTPDPGRDPDLRARSWPLVPDVPGHPVGFGSSRHVPAYRWSTNQPWTVFAAQTDDLTAVLARHPSLRYVVTLQGADPDRVAEEEWLVRPRVESDDDEVALSVRAAIRRAFPGLHVATEPDEDGAGLLVTREAISALVRIPVAIGTGIAGTRIGAPKSIPVQHLTDTGHVDARTGATVRVGAATTMSGRRVDVGLTSRERLRHLHVMGRTGTGKSTLIASLVREIAATDEGLVVLDPHSTLVDRILAELPPEAVERTWVIRAGDIADPIRINSLAIEDEQQREMAIMEIGEIFQEMFDPTHQGIVGPRFIERITAVLRLLHLVSEGRASLLDIPRVLRDTEFVDSMVGSPAVPDPELQSWLRAEESIRRSSEFGELNAWVTSKFTKFGGTPAMKGILGTGENSIDWTKVMDSGRIVLVDLSKAALGETSSRLLGFLLLNSFWTSALQRKTSRPFSVFVDEVQSFSSATLPDMLSEGRKFGLSVIVAHQYLGQLDTRLRSALDGNVGTTLAFGCSASDAPEIAARFGGLLEPSTFATLPGMTAITMRTAGGVAPTPFSLVVDHNEAMDAQRRDADQLAEIEGTVRRATLAALVEPYREAVGLFEEPRAARMFELIKAGRPESRPRPGPGSSFLDDWLAERSKRSAQEPPRADD